VLSILKEAGWGNISRGVELLAHEKKYGSVTHEGNRYILTGQAEMTSRQLSAVQGYGWYDDNEYFEMSSPAMDGKGNEYTVYWIFSYQFQGEDPETGQPMAAELDAYDYDKVDRIEER
jgi:hypothetical protein